MSQSISPRSSYPSGNCSLLILAFVLPFLIFSCQPVAKKSSPDKAFMLDTLINGKQLLVKDTTQYGSEFINQLKQIVASGESFKVIGDSVWVPLKLIKPPKDTVVTSVDLIPQIGLSMSTTTTWDVTTTTVELIPTVLKLNESYRFASTDQDRNFALTLKRTNYTDLEYNLELDGKTIQSGKAMLQATFYLAKEVFPGKEGGDQMLFDQYIDGGAHWAAIKVETTEGKTVSFLSDVAEVKKFGEIPLLSRN